MPVKKKHWWTTRQNSIGRLVLALLLTSGCAKTDNIAIGGRVTRNDGSPVVGAKVTFRAPSTGRTATGITDADGGYVLGTSQVGEGILANKYYVTIAESQGDEDHPAKVTIHQKYRAADTSGLSADVEPGGTTTFDFVLDVP